MFDPYAKFEGLVLANGLTVMVYTDKSKPFIHMHSVVYGGAHLDPIGEGKDGRAHLAEHLVSNNVEGYTSKEIENFLDPVGGDVFLGGTSWESMGFGFSVPLIDDYPLKIFCLFGQMLLGGQLNRFLENQKKIVLEEFSEKFPNNYGFNRFRARREALFGNHFQVDTCALGGTPGTMDNIGYEDMRIFFDMCFVPANMVLVVSGGLTTSEVYGILRQTLFDGEKPGSRVPPPPPILAPFLYHQVLYDVSYEEDYGPEMVRRSLALAQRFIDWGVIVPVTEDHHALSVYRSALYELLYEEFRITGESSYSVSVPHNRTVYASEAGVFVKVNRNVSAQQAEDMVERCINRVQESDGLIKRIIARKAASFNMADPSAQRICDRASYRMRMHRFIVTNYADRQGYLCLSVDDVKKIGVFSPRSTVLYAFGHNPIAAFLQCLAVFYMQKFLFYNQTKNPSNDRFLQNFFAVDSKTGLYDN